MSVGEASAAVSFYLFVSTIGGFLGGPLADAYGPRRVIIWTLVASVPFLLAGQLASGWTLTLLVCGGGFLLQSTLPVNVTFGQQIAPVSAATVSSLMMGFAWGVGLAARAGRRAAGRHLGSERRALAHGARAAGGGGVRRAAARSRAGRRARRAGAAHGGTRGRDATVRDSRL